MWFILLALKRLLHVIFKHDLCIQVYLYSVWSKTVIQFSHLHVTEDNAYKQTPGEQIFRDKHVLTCYAFLTLKYKVETQVLCTIDLQNYIKKNSSETTYMYL